MHNTTVKFKKVEGQLVPASVPDNGILKRFAMSLPEGAEIEVFLSLVEGSEKSLGQLNKVHKLIRELADSTGNSFNDVKTEVKNRAGLYEITGTSSSDKKLKSFADCTKGELSLAIETCIEIGNDIGIPLY